MVIPARDTPNYYDGLWRRLTCEGCDTVLGTYLPGDKKPTPHTTVDCLQALRAQIDALRDALDTTDNA